MGFGAGAVAITEYCAPEAFENRLPNARSRGRKYQYGACSGRLNTTRPTATDCWGLPPTCAPLCTGTSTVPCSTLLTDQNRTGSCSAAAGAARTSMAKIDATTDVKGRRMEASERPL